MQVSFAVGQRDGTDLFRAVQTAVAQHSQGVLRLVRQDASYDRLCHAAGGAEDGASAGSDAVGHVGRLAFQLCELDTHLLDHHGHFPGR